MTLSVFCVLFHILQSFNYLEHVVMLRTTRFNIKTTTRNDVYEVC